MSADCAIAEFWEDGHRRYFVEAALRGGFPGKLLTSCELAAQLPAELRTAHADQIVALSGVHGFHFRQALAIRRFRRQNPEIKRVVCMFLDDLYRELLILGSLEIGDRSWLRGLEGLLFDYSKFYTADYDRVAGFKLKLQIPLLRGFAALSRTGRILVHDDNYREYLSRRGIPAAQLGFAPDPINPREPLQPQGIDLPASKKLTIGFIGAHAPRKGTTWALNALASSGLPVRAIVAGSDSGDPSLREVCRQAAGQIEVVVYLKGDGIPEAELLWLMARVDVVAIPYRRFYGSSNILIHAMRLQKTVVSTERGVVGNRVRKFGVGCCFPEDDHDAFLQCVASLTKGRPVCYDERAVLDFLGSCTPAAFARALNSASSVGQG